MSTQNDMAINESTPKVSKGYKGMGMEGFIARWYTKNRGQNLEEFIGYARKVAEAVPPGSAVLEIAPGPGYLAIELARMGNYKITGLDISKTFVGICPCRAYLCHRKQFVQSVVRRR